MSRVENQVFVSRWGCATLALCTLAGCGDWRSDPDGFTEADLALISGMVLTPSPADPGNEFLGVPAVETFGQQLFFDQGLAASGSVACTDCHNPNGWFSDTRGGNAVSRGVGVTTRNSPSLVNVGFYEAFGWDGRADSVWGQCHHAYASPRTMAGTPQRLVAGLTGRYEAKYREAFGQELPALPADGGVSPDVDQAYRNVLKAWGAYLATLRSRNAPFDRFAGGEREALTVEQRRGLKLFLGKAGCIECHRGASFTDNHFHSVGIGQSGPGVPDVDLGREAGLQALAKLAYRPADAGTPPLPAPADRGQFRTKSLRQVAKTAPYFHAGQLATLKEVVWFYTQGGDHSGAGETSPFLVPLGLTDPEQADLVAFLEALTGDEVPARLRCDPSLLAPGSDGGRTFVGCP